MVNVSRADPVVVLHKIISLKILGILKTLITVDQMAARQDIFVDLMVSVYRQIIVGRMGVLQDRVSTGNLEIVLFFETSEQPVQPYFRIYLWT